MAIASASGAPRITGTGSPRSEPRSEVLGIPRTKRRRPTLNAFSAIEVLVPYSFGLGSWRCRRDLTDRRSRPSLIPRRTCP